MKRISALVVAVAVMSVSMVSCGSKDKEASKSADDKLGKMEVVIPDELKDNEEIVEYIEGMSEVADAYALVIDEAISELGEYAGKDWEELNMREQMKVTATSARIAMKAAPTLAKLAELQGKYTLMEDDLELSEDELKALETVMKRFEERMEQIEAKHSEVLVGE